MIILTKKDFYNFNTYWIIKILLILCNICIIFRDKVKFVFYIKNYIN